MICHLDITTVLSAFDGQFAYTTYSFHTYVCNFTQVELHEHTAAFFLIFVTGCL